jgi:hypothetical protein
MSWDTIVTDGVGLEKQGTGPICSLELGPEDALGKLVRIDLGKSHGRKV